MPSNRVRRRIPPIQTFFWIALEPKTLQLPINSFMQAIQNLQPESMNGLLHFVGPRKYGGRDRVRTCDPLLAKQIGQKSKCLFWCRLRAFGRLLIRTMIPN